MTRVLVRSVLGTVIVTAVLFASACATPGGASRSTPITDPSAPGSYPSTTAEGLAPDHVVVEAQQLLLAAADGTTIDSLAFSIDPLGARKTLSDWFGFAPTTTTSDSAHYCAEPGVTIVDQWGDGLKVIHGGSIWAGYNVRFNVYVSGPAVGNLAIEAFDGTSVGDASDALLAALPIDKGAYFEKQTGDDLTRIYFDVPNDDYAAYAFAFDGEGIAQIIAPYFLKETC